MLNSLRDEREIVLDSVRKEREAISRQMDTQVGNAIEQSDDISRRRV